MKDTNNIFANVQLILRAHYVKVRRAERVVLPRCSWEHEWICWIWWMRAV